MTTLVAGCSALSRRVAPRPFSSGMLRAITDWNLSLDQFLDLPEAKPALEYDPPCDGHGATVRQKMSPTAGHSALQHAFEVLLDSLEGQGLVVRLELRVVRGS